MKNKLQIIETPDYIVAVSDEVAKTDRFTLNLGNKEIIYVSNIIGSFVHHKIERGVIELTNTREIIAYQPKSNALLLDLPLLPEIVVEDEVEKLAKIEYPSPKIPDISKTYSLERQAFKRGCKAAYSEEDLRKAFEHGIVFKEESVSTCKEAIDAEFDALIKFIKQPKTPTYFVAEMEYFYHSGKEFYSDAGFVKCDKETYESVKKEIPICPLKTELKTTTINGKTYLVGTYLNE
jgi:hypothetical protein